MAGRRTTPLFDLLNKSQASTPAPERPSSKPVVRVELKPREPSYAPDPMPAPEQVVRVNGKPFPVWVKSVIVVVVFLAIVGAWSFGAWFGQKRAEKDLADQVRREPPQIQEPGELTGQPGAPVASHAATVPARPTPTRSESPVTSGKSLPPADGTDPREKGKNYLYLANLPVDDAGKAVEVLREHGVNAHFVPVESGARGANNAGPGLYRVFVGDGLTKEQFSQSVRTNLEAEVVRLGAVWQKEHRGSSNFAKFGWEKFQ